MTTTDTLLKQLYEKLNYWGIDHESWELEYFEFSDGDGFISWVHKYNDKSLPYVERRLAINPFYYNDNDEIFQYEHPCFS